MDCMNTRYYGCHNCSCGTTAGEKQMWYRDKLEVSQTMVFEVLCDDELNLWHYSRSAHQFSDDTPPSMHFCEWHTNCVHRTIRLNYIMCARSSIYCVFNQHITVTFAALQTKWRHHSTYHKCGYFSGCIGLRLVRHLWFFLGGGRRDSTWLHCLPVFIGRGCNFGCKLLLIAYLTEMTTHLKQGV